IAPWITHLAFRLYSMTLTSTVIGLIMGALYRPRTWCSVCPVNTVSDMDIMKKDGQVKSYRKAS
ncbi:MAG TPA: 4Fe-4S binding protein, partial [Clostridiaceae bacterium]|nr:4Fe-4S binding protein [Clostridiaceae bacterium]